MIYLIPIEPLEERYTEQWYRWFPEELKKRKIPYQIIDGETLTNEVKTGTFLDINSTLYYKSEQLKKIAKLFYEKKIKDGDRFFIYDLEFWGIESIRYLADLNNIKVKIFGFCHAMSYTKEDFISKCERYAVNFERGWFDICDKVFVGSQYHKKQIYNTNRCYDSGKIIVTGNPYKVSEVESLVGKVKKVKRIIHTNRPDYEKRPNLTLQVFQILKTMLPDYEFMVTTSRKQWGKGWIRDIALDLQKKGVITIKEGLSKKEYLTLLAESQIMTGNTIEENFGYCVLEAMIFNTYPVVPNDYSHKELLNNQSEFLFDNIDMQIPKIIDLINKKYSKDISHLINENSLERIVKEICD